MCQPDEVQSGGARRRFLGANCARNAQKSRFRFFAYGILKVFQRGFLVAGDSFHMVQIRSHDNHIVVFQLLHTYAVFGRFHTKSARG